MKKLCFTVLIFLLVQFAHSQYSLLFCEDVTADGKPVAVSNQFQVGDEGGALKILVRTDEKFNTDQVNFRIYYLSDGGTEEELISLPQTLETDWNFVWKELQLFTPGVYRIKIYNSKSVYLTSANLTIRQR